MRGSCPENSLTNWKICTARVGGKQSKVPGAIAHAGSERRKGQNERAERVYNRVSSKQEKKVAE